ncbi:hypothetical protein HK405_000663 [Cladochytrium tenue]|nr:hypothetical protein HK405_000663 [Cladochytrium tenue]
MKRVVSSTYTKERVSRELRPSWANKDVVRRINRALSSKGLSVWMDETSIGMQLYASMAAAVLSATVFVPCLSKDYEASYNCKLEICFAANNRKPLAPVRLDNGPYNMCAFLTAHLLYVEVADDADFDNKVDALYQNILKTTSGSIAVSPISTTAGLAPALMLSRDRLSGDGILDQSSNGDTLLLRHVLELVVLQRDPLTPTSIAALLGAQPYKIEGVLDALLPALATDDHGHVRLKDSGFADYLADQQRCTDPRFAVDKTAANMRIAAFCLEVLSRELRANMCGFQNAFEASRRMADMSSNEQKELRGRIPAHVVYAARFWMTHIFGSDRAVDSDMATTVIRHAAWPKLRQRIVSFSTTAIVFWIEVLAVLGALDTLQTAAANLAPLLMDSEETFALFMEAAALLERFPELHGGSPVYVYTEVMARLPQDSILSRLLRGSAVLPFPIAVGEPASRTLGANSNGVWSVAFSSDGNSLASGSWDGTIKLWEAATGQLIRTMEAHSDVVQSVAFSGDGKTVVSGSWDHRIKLWGVATGRLLQTLEAHSERVWSVAFSSDGRMVASGSSDGTIKLWEVATGWPLRTSGNQVRTLTGHSDVVRSVAFSSDGFTVASGSKDKTVKLWKTTTGTLQRTMRGHTADVTSIAISRNGDTIVSGSGDRTIKLWETATGQLLRSLMGHSDVVRSVAFSNDRNVIASGSYDKTIKLWDAATGQLLRTLDGYSKGGSR